MAKLTQRLGILGGTFNPVHWGHLVIAEAAIAQADLDAVIWVVNPSPPYKSNPTLATVDHRVAMVQAAIASHPNFWMAPDTVAQQSAYAIHSLQHLQQHYPQTEWHWILGLDAFQSLPRWVGHAELVTQCHWLIAPRLGDRILSNPSDPATSLTLNQQIKIQCQQVHQLFQQRALALQWQILTIPFIDISSSLIRRYCRDRHSIRYLVPDPVRHIINQYRFYESEE